MATIIKELSIEEKAKRYDEAIEKAKKYHEECKIRGNDWFVEDMEDMFPELKESEDERIIHWIRKELEAKYVVDNIVNNEIADKALAWLEKQGEHNPYSGVSFKYNGHTLGMCARDNGVDILLDKQLFKHLEKQCEQKPTDEEMKILLQTEYEKGRADAIEQNTAWSEEDELMLESATEKISDFGTGEMTKDWLKSLKERYTWKPSDEQIQALEYQVHSTYEGSWQYRASKELLEQLKKL